ncbi:methyl-accepting chemotaxis protein [Vibrio splendidus]|uniref:methyl-accepting chemotaxis protein n=1 Tax=Vibrio splendidus TaxID=29497 RepID=UPI0009C016FB|nr:methyl-accepting chemotaxis protein [Vibrio splendidus]
MSNKLKNNIYFTELIVILTMTTSLLNWNNFKKSSTVSNRKPLGYKFNAPTEAALAGVQGFGFAILADEVRHLANRTQQSTTKVKEVITSLQHEASNSITTIEDMKAPVSRKHVQDKRLKPVFI